MKKTFARTLAVLLTLALLIGCGLLQAMAAPFSFSLPVSEAEWDAIWEKIDETGSVVALTPGSNPTERNLAWQSGPDAKEPVVRLSKSADMGGAVTFTGTSALNPLTGLLTNYVTVKGLTPETAYYYQCATTLDQRAVYSFTTGPATGFKAVMFADIHVKSEADGSIDEKSSGMIWNRALESALAREPNANLILAAGDNANVGVAREYLGLYAPPALRSIPFAASMGNHDKKDFNFKYYMNNPNAHRALLGTLQGGDYWFRYNEVLVLVFDSTNGSASDHFNFAKGACAANKDAKWRIAMYHHDLHATLWPIKDLEGWAMQQIFDPIIAYFDVDAVFVGHNHRYIRTHMLEGGKVAQRVTGSEVTDPKGTVYIGNTSVVHVSSDTSEGLNPENAFVYCEPDTVTYNVITIEGNRLNVKACKVEDGEVIDEFTIIKSNCNTPKNAWFTSFGYNIIKLLAGVYALIAWISDTITLRNAI